MDPFSQLLRIMVLGFVQFSWLAEQERWMASERLRFYSMEPVDEFSVLIWDGFGRG
jgi:hypothetical protein